MAYYRLSLYHDDDVYEDIKGLNNIPGFEEINDKSLKDIVKFTNKFNSERDLKETLLYTGIISKDSLASDFAINFYRGKNHQAQMLPYGISYKKDKKFFDFDYLLSFYLAKQKNSQFMSIFLSKFYQKLKDISIFSDLYYIKDCDDYYDTYGILLPEAADAMTGFLNNYCYRRDKDGIRVIDFSRIRELAMLAINFENNRKKEERETIVTMIEDLKTELFHYKSLLQNSALTYEQTQVYENEVLKLERKISEFE